MRRRLTGSLLFQIVRLRKRTFESPVDFLLLVIDLDLGEVEGALLHGRVATSRLVRGDENVKERVLQEFLKYSFFDVFISSYQTGGSDSPMEQCSFNFTKIQVDYKEQKIDGTLKGALTKSYDLKQQRAG